MSVDSKSVDAGGHRDHASTCALEVLPAERAASTSRCAGTSFTRRAYDRAHRYSFGLASIHSRAGRAVVRPTSCNGFSVRCTAFKERDVAAPVVSSCARLGVMRAQILDRRSDVFFAT